MRASFRDGSGVPGFEAPKRPSRSDEDPDSDGAAQDDYQGRNGAPFCLTRKCRADP